MIVIHLIPHTNKALASSYAQVCGSVVFLFIGICISY